MLFRTLGSVSCRTNVSASALWRRSISFSSRTLIDAAAKDGELRVFVVAGEVSGDGIGSRLMASLKKLSPVPIRFSGIGGSMMSQHGLKSLFPMEEIAVMGIWELLPHLHKFRVKLMETTEAALLFRPHVVVTVDSKGFSFRLLKHLRARYRHQRTDCPAHFHYVAPSFWAWKGGEARLKGLTDFVDHVFCILPGEAEVCKSKGLDATFVGHPILEDVIELNLGSKTSPTEWKVHGNCENFRREYDIPPGATIISVLPGSRLQEVTRMLPIFENTIKLVQHSLPELTTVIHVAQNLNVENYIRSAVQKWPVPVISIPGGIPWLKYNAFSASKVALCTSGTVALELQLARLPCVIAYRAHFLTECFIRYKAKISYISIPNILLNSAIIPEALFQACKSTKLATLLMELLVNEGGREEQIAAAEQITKLLSPPKLGVSNKSVKCQDLRRKFSDSTPSMLAASTILHYIKPLRLYPGSCC